ncbi:aldo/keto reductase [Lacticaseibacillus parakribbianus]|uniref:aldo/keto reductase n=1 Tax=Lacticaseibacillus parakribbianus TaxID=2970927 RepID=UPI0021CB8910|nr:aldo/keto reductase [Lacticaseibacillus parakribbianus]
MKMIDLGQSGLKVSAIALGVMRITGLDLAGATNLLEASHDAGINFFDNADIYGDGKSETLFGQALKNANFKREDVIVQSKAGIVSGQRYDWSHDHIIEAVDGSLKRLGVDYLDVLLLHRPDALFEPEAVASAFDELHNSGKVRSFGVSNCNPSQIELLKSAVSQPLVANQLQFSLMHTGMIDSGIHVNMTDDRSLDHDGGILEYSRLHNMTIQAWSPYQYGFFEGVFIDSPKFPKLNAKLQALADAYHTNKNAIASAWLIRVPGTQVIAGTTNAHRIQEIAEAGNIRLQAQEWYDLYFAAGNDLP